MDNVKDLDNLNKKNVNRKIFSKNSKLKKKLMINKKFWKNKRVLITGHTGFKGGFYQYWIKMLGAKVAGYSIDPITKKIFSTLQSLKKF